jgi:hypothetical protein
VCKAILDVDSSAIPVRTVYIKPELHPDTLASVLTPISRFTVDTNRLSGYSYANRDIYFKEVATYAPSVLAATDMYKRHLNLISDFIDTNRNTRESHVKTMQQTTYHQKANPYTTLETTKEFIRKNKPKTLSMEEALALVREEARY